MTDGLLAFINIVFVFFLLVVAHELGHFLAAKWSKMRVDRFQVGFGPSVLKLGRWGETEFSVGPFPFGGFVAIHGMIPGDYAPEERAFQDAPLGKRMITIAAGPAMSLLLGYVLFILVGTAYGVLDVKLPPTIGQVDKGRIAYDEGIRAGDSVVEINGEAVTEWSQVSDMIHNSVGKPVALTLEREGRRFEVSVVPEATELLDYTNPLRPTTKTVGRIFCSPELERQRVGPLEAVAIATVSFDLQVKALVGTLTSRLITKSIAGPLGIVSLGSQASQRGFADVLEFAGMLSLSLGVINLIPLPVLDGGHLMLFTVEWLRRGKKLPAKTQIGIQAAGVILLLLLFVLVTTLDIQRLVNGGSP